MTGEPRDFGSYNIGIRDKTKQLELYLTYNYLIEVSKRFNIELSAGIAYERNDTYGLYVSESYFAEIGPNGEYIDYQKVYQNIFEMQNRIFRRHLGVSVGY